MKRIFTISVLMMLFFNWIGYQLYTAIVTPSNNQSFITNTDENDSKEEALTPYAVPDFHISMYAKELDFDDLFQFTSKPNYSVNEIFFTASNPLFLDHANKESQRVSFKCFNGEYYSQTDKWFAKYPDAYSSSKLPDRYLLKLPIVFIGPKDHPPQYIG